MLSSTAFACFTFCLKDNSYETGIFSFFSVCKHLTEVRGQKTQNGSKSFLKVYSDFNASAFSHYFWHYCATKVEQVRKYPVETKYRMWMLFQEKRHLHLILEQLASNLCRKLECKNELNVSTTRLGSQCF